MCFSYDLTNHNQHIYHIIMCQSRYGNENKIYVCIKSRMCEETGCITARVHFISILNGINFQSYRKIRSLAEVLSDLI